MTTSKRHAPKPESPAKITPPEAPAKIQDDHFQDRPYVIEIGAGKGRRHVKANAKGYSRLSVLQQAKRNRHLIDRALCTDKNTAKDEEFRGERRYVAGTRFTEAWLAATAANWASGSDLTRVRVAGVPGSFVDHALSEKQFLENVRKKLGVNDWMILRRICGENTDIALVIKDISPAYRYAACARFRESLDALIVVIEG